MELAFGVIYALAFLAFIIWIAILLPASMAGNRNRSKLGWVFISLFFTPPAAIVGLMVLGNAPEPQPIEGRKSS